LDKLSAEWNKGCYRAGDRLSRHVTVVANPSVLAEDRIVVSASSDNEDPFEGSDKEAVFDTLDGLFKDKYPEADARELLHQRRVTNPTLISTKIKRGK